MKILLTTLNAKFIHSSLALYSLKSYAKKYYDSIEIKEFTINSNLDVILSEIFKIKPDVLGFSCYIWNINETISLVSNLKKVLPECKIVLGGPEVSYDSKALIKSIDCDYIISGEGEGPFLELLDALINNTPVEKLAGVSYMKDGEIISSENSFNIPLKDIDFVYTDILGTLENKLLYYETSRGCPYSCQYCLSSVEKGVKFLDIERVKSDLQFFLSNNVRQVKFVDRTFNCNPKHAIEIWEYLILNDNGTTNFHFEISADIITEKMFKVLENARPGLFQFEIGVQSTNLETLSMIERATNLEKLQNNVEIIKGLKNIHQHLDLIVGLPGEDFQSFRNSFNQVYLLEPEQLQIGFLKLLKGSGLRNMAAEYGLVYRDQSPYEILMTNDLTYGEITVLKNIEELVEVFYNSGKFFLSLKFIISFYKSPFDFYYEFQEYYISKEYHLVSHKKNTLYEIFKEFSLLNEKINQNVLDNLIKFDIYFNENLKNMPEFLKTEIDEVHKKYYRDFYNENDNLEKYLPSLLDGGFTGKQMSRMTKIEFFDIDILKFMECGVVEEKAGYILFDYYGKDSYLNIFGFGNSQVIFL